MLFRIRKEILIINDGEGSLGELEPRFDELSINVTHLSASDWIIPLLEGMPSFAVVMVNGRDLSNEFADKLFATVHNLDDAVPFVWVSHGDSYVPSVGERKPDAVIRMPASQTVVFSTVNRILTQRFFPDIVRNLFIESCSKTMAEAFATHVSQVQNYLKADEMSLAPISAMVSFVGEKSQGCVTVSGTSDFFQACHQRLLGDYNVDPPTSSSIAGEICNQITGRFKAELANYGFSLRHSFPILVQAHPLSLTYGGPGRLSFVQALTDGKGDLYLELCFDVLDIAGMEEFEQKEDYESGVLMFL